MKCAGRRSPQQCGTTLRVGAMRDAHASLGEPADSGRSQLQPTIQSDSIQSNATIESVFNCVVIAEPAILRRPHLSLSLLSAAALMSDNQAALFAANPLGALARQLRGEIQKFCGRMIAEVAETESS